MILFVAIGFLVQHFTGWPNAVVLGLLAGMVVALFVGGSGGACALPSRDRQPPP